MTYLVAKTFPGVSKGTTKLKNLHPSFFFKLRTYSVDYKEKYKNPVFLVCMKNGHSKLSCVLFKRHYTKSCS